MRVNNPFVGRGAPVRGSRLVGREHQIALIERRLDVGAHCSIVGLPRLGKTSVAKEVLNRLSTKRAQEGVKCAYISLDAMRGPIQTYTRILDETAIEDSKETHHPHFSDHDLAYDYLLRQLRTRRKSGLRSIVVIDEFDAITTQNFADPYLFVSRIRELANDSERYGVTFLFVSRRSLDMIQGNVDCSTLAGLCEVIYMQPLSQQEVRQLCLKSPIPPNEEAQQALWYMSGGHPFLAEVVMCEVVELCNAMDHISSRHIEDAQSHQAHEFTNQYRQLRELLNEKGMFDTLCEYVVGPLWRPIDLHNVTLLKQYGLIKNSELNQVEPTAMSGHFQDYLRSITRLTPTWELLGKVERELRVLVNDTLSQRYGDHWVSKLLNRHPTLQRIMDAMELLRQKEKKQFGSAAADFILEYAYIGDLQAIVFSEWSHFSGILKDSKSEWDKRFISIIRVRNPMAHHRTPPADAVHEAEISCKILSNRLGQGA